MVQVGFVQSAVIINETEQADIEIYKQGQTTLYLQVNLTVNYSAAGTYSTLKTCYCVEIIHHQNATSCKISARAPPYDKKSQQSIFSCKNACTCTIPWREVDRKKKEVSQACVKPRNLVAHC